MRGFSALQIGYAVFTTGLFQILSIPIYAVLARRVDLRWLMMFGLACFGLSMWDFAPMTHDWGWRELLLPQGLRGFAQQFAVAPAVISLREAQTQAFADSFLAIAAAFVVATVMVPVMRKVVAPAAPSAPAH